MSAHTAQSFTGVGADLNQRAAAAIDRGDYKEAERLYHEALALRRERLGPEHLDVAQSLSSLAWVCRRLQRFGEAEALYLEALAIRRKLLGSDDPDVARSLTSLGACLTKEGRYLEAEKSLTEALMILRKAPDPPHSYECVTLDELAELYEVWGQSQRANEYRRQIDPSASGHLPTNAEE